DRLCLLIVAPVFDERVFPTWRYQRGGIVKDTAVQDPRGWARRGGVGFVALGGRGGEAAPPLFLPRPSPRGPISRRRCRLCADRRETHRGRQRGKLRVSEPGDRRAIRPRKGLFWRRR